MWSIFASTPKCATKSTANGAGTAEPAKKPVILEIDPPEDEVSARRKGFL